MIIGFMFLGEIIGSPRPTGIALENDVSYAEIKDNYFYKCDPAGIDGTGDFTSTLFSCNTFEECYNGLQFDNATLSDQGDATHGAGNQWINCTNYNYEITNPVSSSTYWHRNISNEDPTSGAFYSGSGDWDPKVISGSNTISNCSTVNKTDGNAISTGGVKSLIEVYPNPTNGLLFIGSKVKSIQIIELYDLNGKILHSKTVESNEYRLDLSEHPNGFYLLKIISNSKIEFRKIVKQ